MSAAAAAVFSRGLEDLLVTSQARPRMAGVEVQLAEPQVAKGGRVATEVVAEDVAGVVAEAGVGPGSGVRRRLGQEVPGFGAVSVAGSVVQGVVVEVAVLIRAAMVPVHRRRGGQGHPIWTKGRWIWT